LYFIVFYCEIHLKYCQDTINRQFNSTMENKFAGKTEKLFDVGQREVIVFIYVSYLTRESTLYFLNVNKYWKRWEKEANIVKGARFCYCVQYALNLTRGCHKFYYLAPFTVFDSFSHPFLPCQCLFTESTLYFLNVNKYWKRWEKEANIVKGARFCYCRIYHKFVNFIILNLFKLVKWTSCSLLTGRWVHSLREDEYTPYGKIYKV
jgi:hypothetical protein